MNETDEAVTTDEILYFVYGNTKDTNIELAYESFQNYSASTYGTLNLTLDVVADSTNRIADDSDDVVMVWTTDNSEILRLGTKASGDRTNTAPTWANSNANVGAVQADTGGATIPRLVVDHGVAAVAIITGQLIWFE